MVYLLDTLLKVPVSYTTPTLFNKNPLIELFSKPPDIEQ